MPTYQCAMCFYSHLSVNMCTHPFTNIFIHINNVSIPSTQLTMYQQCIIFHIFIYQFINISIYSPIYPCLLSHSYINQCIQSPSICGQKCKKLTAKMAFNILTLWTLFHSDLELPWTKVPKQNTCFLKNHLYIHHLWPLLMNQMFPLPHFSIISNISDEANRLQHILQLVLRGCPLYPL